MGKMTIFFIVGMVLAIWGGFSGCKDKGVTIVIEEPTELLEKADIKDAPGNKVVYLLEKGMKGRVVHARYTKDFMFYKIRTENGRVGYVMYGDNIKVIEGK